MVSSLLTESQGHFSPPEMQKEETPSHSEPVLRDLYIPLEPNADQMTAIELAIVTRFSDVFDQEGGLRQMAGPDMVIQLRDDAVPYYVNGARPIAFGDRPEVKGLLDALVAKKVIEPISDASELAAPLVVIRNAKTGKLRLCVNQTQLNKFVMRPIHVTRTPRDAVAEVDSECRFFTSLDATKGYFQIPLHPSSQHLTVFMTP